MSNSGHIERDSGRCPTCGQRVGTFTTDEGTSYYLATAEQEASEAEYLREQLQEAQAQRDDLAVELAAMKIREDARAARAALRAHERNP